MILDFSRSNVLSGAIRSVRVALYDSSELADEESLTPLGNSPLGIISEVVDEEDQEEFLPLQLPNDALAGEADDDDEADEGDNDNEGGERRRSLAPEPEDGLLVEIRQGRIPGLASPERWTGEE